MNEPIARVRIELEGTDPLIWREVDVPLSTRLAALHDIIQVAMRWQDCHLHEFVVGNRVYANPDPDDPFARRKIYKDKSVWLGTLIDRGIREFLYVYDFGDNWQHRIILGEVRQGDPDTDYPAFVGGARRAPPEDVGGVPGFEEFLEAVADPKHEEHERMLEWYGGTFDPEDIDDRRIRMIIGDLAARRRGPLSSHRERGRKGPS